MRTMGLALAFLGMGIGAAARAEPALLGKIDFPTTGPKAARAHFLRGMLAMHSFWYEEARDEFRAATAAAPSFAMGYWGEAMSWFHPIWAEESVVGSRAALAKLPVDAAMSARERRFIEAARILDGDGERQARWKAYAAALAALRREHPEDDEAATLYAAAILGIAIDAREAGKPTGFRPFAEAGAIALDVLGRNPEHPGAAHYAIHAFDDPEHAVLALPAARRYAQIAPESAHARHMPSHIFVQLGMWREAQASNEAAWEASGAWVSRKHLDVSYRDFHSLSWLVSIDLELGQKRRALEVLGRARAALAATRDADQMGIVVANMALEIARKTGDWKKIDEALAPLDSIEQAVLSSKTQKEMPGCAGHVAKAAARAKNRAEAIKLFARGEAAEARKDAAAIERAAEALAALVKRNEKELALGWEPKIGILRAAAAELRGRSDAAIAELRAAIAADERVPPVGPEPYITPRERLGELLLRLGRPADALAELRASLGTHPRRARSLLYALRAATAARDPFAAEARAELAEVWANADADMPGVSDLKRATSSSDR